MEGAGMSLMEIITRLGLLQIALSNTKIFREDPELAKNVIALKRAMQILVSLDLKNEMKSSEENG